MVNKRAFLALILATTLVGSVSASFAADVSVTRPSAKGPVATNHGPQLVAPVTALFFVGDRLLNVYRAVHGLGWVDLPTRGTVYQAHGIQDGPDGVDPLGVKDTGLRTGGPAPAPNQNP